MPDLTGPMAVMDASEVPEITIYHLKQELAAAKEELETYKRMIAPKFMVAAFESIKIMTEANQNALRLWTKAAYHNARMSNAIKEMIDATYDHRHEFPENLIESMRQIYNEYKEEDFRIG